ncbi:hypothetical protein [Enterocloster clostridioformis]|uniref:Uncharacterized protein n=1 Tax=Enterocloster clostridioformis TaxID=1531 RepID=A0AAP9S669_9FIRM|nr:hypothetical protein [Enterocloster clostridioformis]QIX89141.1 hypothetical protein FOC47_00195 [Enterocloster clostridioformis]
MLDWKEIKGYDKNKDYKWQEGVELPGLDEEILIQVTDENLPDRAPFVGSFKRRNDGHVWMIISVNGGMTFYEVQDGVKWARFNRP